MSTPHKELSDFRYATSAMKYKIFIKITETLEIVHHFETKEIVVMHHRINIRVVI
jgi:hypothetical protein